MINNTEINIFIENEYENFEGNVDLAALTQDAQKMTEYLLSKEEWVKNSCLKGYDCRLLYFDAVLCSDEKIHQINLNYREKDCPTDVITFAIFADSPKEERFIFDNEINLGEIFISLDRTAIQAKENTHHRQSFKQELYFLLAHGILHLLGYDHTTEETLQTMWDMQKEMIEETGINV